MSYNSPLIAIAHENVTRMDSSRMRTARAMTDCIS